MNSVEILNKLATIKNGRYISITKSKDLGTGVSKISKMVLRKGVKAGNTSLYADRQPGALPWGHWVEGLENLVIEHKGNYYLRVTSKTPEDPENGADVISTEYILNGASISKEEAIAIVGEKKMEGKAAPFYNIKLDNILDISGC